MSEERWLPVVGWEDRYEVSDLGRVRSVDRTYIREHRISSKGYHVVRQRGRMRALAHAKAGGYLVATLHGETRRGETKHVHRLVMDAFVGPTPEGMQVRHLDGDPTNNRLENLVYGTPSENIRDQRRHGTCHQANKTHCPRGHPYDDANTYVSPSRPGARYCRACRRRPNREAA